MPLCTRSLRMPETKSSLVAEWFPPKQIGFAQGIYGGWGNFGSFAAEAALPLILQWSDTNY